MMLFESLIFNLLPAAVGIMVLVLVFESCWRKCPPDKLMIVSGAGVAAGIKAQAEAYNGMDNPYLLANRYIDIMPKVAEQVAKPLTAVDSIKMYGSGNAQKLVKETTSIVDQVASGLKDSTGIDLPSLLNGLISNPDIDVDSAENSVE